MGRPRQEGRAYVCEFWSPHIGIDGGWRLSWDCPTCGHPLEVEITPNREIVISLRNAGGNHAPRLPRTPTDQRKAEALRRIRATPTCRHWRRSRSQTCQPTHH